MTTPAADLAARGDSYSSPLAADTMARLRAYFAKMDHHPSDDHWAAIGDVVSTLDAMASGTALPKVFLSALDPGVGKTSAVVAFASSLMASPAHVSVGMIICVGRNEEANSLAHHLERSRPGGSFVVLTGDTKDGMLSAGEDWTQAQVLITTQQRIERATDGRTFAECSSFHYRGSPRAVRAWDESWLPGVTVSLSKYDLQRVTHLILDQSRPCADAVGAFATTIDTIADGGMVPVPDFETEHGVSFLAIRGLMPRDDEKPILAALATINGRTARVRDDGLKGSKVLSYRDTLPSDLRPLLVLDASGRVRETYKLIEQYRGLERLGSAVKNYSPLTVHLWRRPGSKDGWKSRRGAAEMIAAIRETIQERLHEDWLIVAHKPEGAIPNVHAKVTRGLKATGDIRTITWGRHMATNEYAEFPNVILAGTLFMASSHYTALTHLARDLDVAGGLAPRPQVSQIERGEHANFILQAVCRGRIRKSDGDRCHPMNAYIIGSKRSGIPELVETVFPGCSVVTWRETEAPRTPTRVRQAIGFVGQRQRDRALPVTNPEIRAHLGLDRSNFTKRVLGHHQWHQGLQRLGLEEYQSRGSRPGGVRQPLL